MSLVDQNTEESIRLTSTTLKYLYKFINEVKNNHMEKISKENMKDLEKNHPQKIKLADIHKDDVDIFVTKAREKNVKCFEIQELEDTDIHNLKYSIDDEYKIIEIFKNIQLEKEINKDSLDIDFEQLKEDLKKYTGKDIDSNDFKKVVEDIKNKNFADKDKSSIEDIRKEVESKVKEELQRSQEDKFKKRNRGNLER